MASISSIDKVIWQLQHGISDHTLLSGSENSASILSIHCPPNSFEAVFTIAVGLGVVLSVSSLRRCISVMSTLRGCRYTLNSFGGPVLYFHRTLLRKRNYFRSFAGTEGNCWLLTDWRRGISGVEFLLLQARGNLSTCPREPG
jgi:hypothetical protein